MTTTDMTDMTNTIPSTDDELANRAKHELVIGLLDHIGYDREIGEGANGELDKPHLRALLEHAREHLPAADQLLDEADEKVVQAIEWGLDDFEACDQVEPRLLLGRLVDNDYPDRVALTSEGYAVTEGSVGSYRSEELQAIYRVFIGETPEVMEDER